MQLNSGVNFRLDEEEAGKLRGSYSSDFPSFKEWILCLPVYLQTVVHRCCDLKLETCIHMTILQITAILQANVLAMHTPAGLYNHQYLGII